MQSLLHLLQHERISRVHFRHRCAIPLPTRESHGFAGSKSEENAWYPENAVQVGAAFARTREDPLLVAESIARN